MATAEVITERQLLGIVNSRELPEDGYAGCPYDRRTSPHAWLVWNAAEHMSAVGLPVELYGDFGLVEAA